MSLTSPQLRTLHTLFGLYSRHLLDPSGCDPRTARLAWASQQLGRRIASFRELSGLEAAQLIDRLKQLLGQETKVAPSRRRPGRRTAQAYGTAGRRGRNDKEILLVDDETRRLLDGLLAKLGWTSEQLDFFLHSRRSPVKSGTIRTLAEANRVIWALKNMLRHNVAAVHGKSEEDGTLRRAG
jgi:hypothetical protein